MSKQWFITASMVGLVLAVRLGAQAQILGTGVIPVTEIGPNLIQNSVTAAQSILAVENQLINLVPLDTIIAVDGVVADLAALADIMNQVQGLSYDLQSLQAQITALFDLENAPASTTALQERLAAIRRVRAQGYVYAMQLQTLATTALRTVDHLTTLVSSIGNFLGAQQSAQHLAQTNATISKTLVILEVQTAAYQRAGSVDKLEELLTIESLERIHEQVMADWPRR